ncbi:MAG: DUF4157 domain-containing protein, partial [Nodosilinea sp.]
MLTEPSVHRPMADGFEVDLGNQALGQLIATGHLQRPIDHGRLTQPAFPSPTQRSQDWLGFRGLSHDLRAPGASSWVQAKLTLGASTSQHEQEADRLASQAVKQIRRPYPSSTQPVRGSQTQGLVHRAMPAPEASAANLPLSPQLETAIAQEEGHGQPIAEGQRRPLEQAFNADFSRVRIHANPRADRLSRSLGAIAFTKGRDIFFKQGAYQPKSHRGQELLAHELTHVIQQSGQGRLVQRKVGNTPAQNKTGSPAQPGSLTGDLLQQTPTTAEAARALLSAGLPNLDLGSGLSILNPNFTVTEKANDFSIAIGGTAALDLGSDLDNLQSKGTWKIAFESKQKGWTVELLESSITAQLDQLFVFNAENLEYNLKDRCLKVPNASVEVPKLNNTTAKAQDIAISREGLDWKDLTVTTDAIDLGGILSLKDITGKVKGKNDHYAFDASAGLGLKLSSGDLDSLTVEGKASLGYANKALTYGFE